MQVISIAFSVLAAVRFAKQIMPPTSSTTAGVTIVFLVLIVPLKRERRKGLR
jgi:hypothetical protein